MTTWIIGGRSYKVDRNEYQSYTDLLDLIDTEPGSRIIENGSDITDRLKSVTD